MSKLKYAVIGALVAGLAGLAAPELMSWHKKRKEAEELEASVERIKLKLERIEQGKAAAVAARHPGPAVAKLNKSHSEVDGVDWLMPYNMGRRQDVFTAYVGDNGAQPWLRVLVARSVGSKVLMLNAVTIAASGVRATSSGKLETESDDGGRMFESIDLKADQAMTAALISAADRLSGAIKMTGYNGDEERPLTDDELTNLRRVIEAYRELGGR